MKGCEYMGLIYDEIEISANAQVKYFENLGYKIPKYVDSQGRLRVARGTTIRVKVQDLKPKSHFLVDVKCDYCNNKSKTKYSQYLDTINSETTEGKYACPSCMRKLFRGEKHPAWKPEKTQEERELERKTEEYALFIKKVGARDNYICRCCGKRCSKDLRVHHLNGYHWYMEGRVDPENAVCLCKVCHDNFHSVYGKGNNTKEQFEEWLGKTLENLQYSNEPLISTRKIYCIEDDIVYSGAPAIRDILGLKSEAQIYAVCNFAHKYINNNMDGNKLRHLTSGGKHFLWFEDYQKMSKKEILSYMHYCKYYGETSVICITTNKIFYSISEAAKFYNCFTGNIHKCCKGEYHTCGHLKDGTKLKWMYYKDYINQNTLKEICEPCDDDAA